MKRTDEGVSSSEGLADAFDREAPVYADGYTGHTSIAHSFNIRRQRVYELIESCPGGRVLDVGCGPGITVRHLTHQGFEFYGVDLSREMIRECQKKFVDIPAAHFSTGSIEKLEFPDAFFDVVLSMGVVEYLDEDLQALREMTRVLKPEGVLIVTLPNQLSPYRIWDRLFYRPVYHFFSDGWKRVRGRAVEKRIAHREFEEKAYARLAASCGL